MVCFDGASCWRDMVKAESQVAGSMTDPLVCVALDGCTVKEMIDEAARANLVGADLVEVRFDKSYLIKPKKGATSEGDEQSSEQKKTDQSQWDQRSVSDIKVSEILSELKGGIPLPVIFSCRPKSEGGFFPGDESERQSVLGEAISSGVSYIDIEISIPEKERKVLMSAAADAGVKVVASIHEEGVPSSDDIIAVVRDNSEKGEILKLCWTTESQQESLKLVEASWELKGEGFTFSIMGLGPGGDWTRLHAPILEQSLVYATLQNDFHLGDKGLVNVRDLRDAWTLMEY